MAMSQNPGILVEKSQVLTHSGPCPIESFKSQKSPEISRMELRCGQSWNSCISLYLRPFGDDFPDQKHHSITSRREVIIKFIQIFSHITISSFFLGILIYPWPIIWYAHYMAHCPKKNSFHAHLSFDLPAQRHQRQDAISSANNTSFLPWFNFLGTSEVPRKVVVSLFDFSRGKFHPKKMLVL